MREESKARVWLRRVPPVELGPMLAAARARTGLAQRRASAIAGLSGHYLNAIEAGQRTPSRVVAERLAEVLELTPDERRKLFAAAVTDAGYSHPSRNARLPGERSIATPLKPPDSSL
ncbi:helix-turn-helix domain-containing protein [Streptomyces sp. NPDC056500]|uniref:helix-turn-helix domain-containing protein n=1 Tax=Streptomyces sp. NPDC056500 TaxID=3345840 RepID=UPI003696624C